MNVVINCQVPLNAGNVACLLPGRAKDLSAHPVCVKLPGNSEDRLKTEPYRLQLSTVSGAHLATNAVTAICCVV